MSGMVLFLCAFACSMISSIISVCLWERRCLHDCNGVIIMHEDEVYLSLTKEDMEAFQKAHYATIKLQRENFKGFSE